MPAVSVRRTIKIRHWLPIVTICPVNKLPDLLYVELEFSGERPPFVELYQARRKVARLLRWKQMFMEDCAELVAKHYPGATRVTVTLLFGRHVVMVGRRFK